MAQAIRPSPSPHRVLRTPRLLVASPIPSPEPVVITQPPHQQMSAATPSHQVERSLLVLHLHLTIRSPMQPLVIRSRRLRRPSLQPEPLPTHTQDQHKDQLHQLSPDQLARSLIATAEPVQPHIQQVQLDLQMPAPIK